jgi:hypothetical protein
MKWFAVLFVSLALFANDSAFAAPKKKKLHDTCPYGVQLTQPCTCYFGASYSICHAGQFCDAGAGCQG